jgi:hypothetical protein
VYKLEVGAAGELGKVDHMWDDKGKSIVVCGLISFVVGAALLLLTESGSWLSNIGLVFFCAPLAAVALCFYAYFSLGFAQLAEKHSGSKLVGWAVGILFFLMILYGAFVVISAEGID